MFGVNALVEGLLVVVVVNGAKVVEKFSVLFVSVNFILLSSTLLI